MSRIKSGYPGNGEYPKPYLPVTVTTKSRHPHHFKKVVQLIGVATGG